MASYAKNIFLLVVLGAPVYAQSPVNGFCIRNNSEESAIFAVDAAGQYREVATLAPGGQLCTPEFETPKGGFVSVFEFEDAIEGCSRLAPAGSTQVLRAYHAFDRCLWRDTL